MHFPFVLQVIGAAHAGASSRFFTIVQVPVAQLRQAAVHASGQQTPSVQNPEAHSLPRWQTLPFCLPVVGALPQAPVPLQVAEPHSRSGSVPLA